MRKGTTLAGLVGLGDRTLIWQPMFIGAVLLGVAGALDGAYCGVKRWRTSAFRRTMAVVLWIAAGELIIMGK